jgi:hypothetical protein
MKTHGASGNHRPTLTYRCWANMIQRCTNPRRALYRTYGGRGITVCERWRRFENFLADMGEQPTEMSLDRIDNNGNYEPGNCRWATRAEQSRNTSRNRMLTFNGVTQCAADWAAAVGIPWPTIHRRLKDGWPIERVLTLRAHESRAKLLTYNGVTRSTRDWARHLGISPELLRWRLARWPLDAALSPTKRGG